MLTFARDNVRDRVATATDIGGARRKGMSGALAVKVCVRLVRLFILCYVRLGWVGLCSVLFYYVRLCHVMLY